MEEVKMKKLIGIIITIAVFIIGISGFTLLDKESAAKRDVNKYFEAMRNGDQDTAINYLSTETDNLLDVFNYDYLSTLEENDLPVKTTMTGQEFIDSEYLKEQYSTFPKYKKFIKESFGNNNNYVVEDEGDSISYYKKGETVKEYVFLYNMEIANGAGEKIYKKVEFTLQWTDKRWNGEDFEKGYEITDITIR
jgi:hypothetical protein